LLLGLVAALLACTFLAEVPAGSVGAASSATSSAADGNHQAKSPVPLPKRGVPALPSKPGCYSYTKESKAWAPRPCETAAYVKAHYPLPTVPAAGPKPDLQQGYPTSSGTPMLQGPDFHESDLFILPIAGHYGSEYDTNHGADAYSLQVNTSTFTGNNGRTDAIQFVDQYKEGNNNICVWQIQETPPPISYNPSCTAVSLNVGLRGGVIEGFSLANTSEGPLVGVAWGPLGEAVMYGVVAADTYGIGMAGFNRWTNSAGSIFGYGSASEAVFSGTEDYFALQAAGCPGKGGVIAFTGPCPPSEMVYPTTYTDFAGDSKAHAFFTLESNNLFPVIGSPPRVLPPWEYSSFGYATDIFYTATPSGDCLSGSLPYCI
jgi:hypothetical protein